MSEQRPPAPRAWRDRGHPVWLYRLVQLVFGWPIRFAFRTRREGHKELPARGPVILASNHASNMDPVLVAFSMRRPVYHLAKHTLFTKWPRRFFFENLAGQIAINREVGGNRAAIVAGVTALGSGVALGIYPEGGRSVDGRVGRGRTGVARLAFLTGAPIYPVAVDGTFQAWPSGQRFPRLFRRTRVIVGAPLTVVKEPAAADDPVRVRSLTDSVMRRLGFMLGQDGADDHVRTAAAARAAREKRFYR